MNGSRRRFGIFEIDEVTDQLLRRGIPVHLENHPLLVLKTLLAHPGEVVSREQLRGQIWPDGTHVSFEAGLNTAIRKLRQALGDSTRAPVFIETLPRRGYRFIAPVTSVPEEKEDAHKNTAPPASVSSGKIPAAPPDTVRAPRIQTIWSYKGVSAAILLVGTVALAAGLSLTWRSSEQSAPGRPAVETRLLGAQTSQALAVSPDGRYVAYAHSLDGKASLRLRQVSNAGDVEILPPAPAFFRGLTFSPDGNFIYFVRNGEEDFFRAYLYRIPALGGASKRLIVDVDSPVSFSPEGDRLVFARFRSKDRTLEVRTANADGSGEELLQLITDSHPGIVYTTWSPDGRTIVASYRRGSQSFLSAIDLSTHRLRELHSSDEFIGRPVFQPEGKTVIFPGIERRSQQGRLWTISLATDSLRQLTSDLNSYSYIFDTSRDGRLGAAVDSRFSGNLWIASVGQLSHPRQFPLQGISLISAEELDDGNFLVEAADSSVWLMKPDGRSLVIFSDHRGPVESCGRFVLTLQSGRLVRVDSDGAHPMVLLPFPVGTIACSPRGDDIFYAGFESPRMISKLSLAGGQPAILAETLGKGLASPLALSRNGEFLAYAFWNSQSPDISFVVLRAKDGVQVARFRASGVTAGGIVDLAWSPDNATLDYVSINDGQRNAWRQPLSGRAPVKITNFDSGIITSIDWSRDGKRLLIVRGPGLHDIVLLSGLR